MTRACESATRHRSHRLPLALGAIIGAGTLGVAGIAVASIPAQGGVINGCYNNTNGQLRVIDSATGDTCRNHESAIQWNQTGPQGPAGPEGPAGPAGPGGATGYEIVESDSASNTADWKTHSAYCPAGKMAVGGGGFIMFEGASAARTSSLSMRPMVGPTPGL